VMDSWAEAATVHNPLQAPISNEARFSLFPREPQRDPRPPAFFDFIVTTSVPSPPSTPAPHRVNPFIDCDDPSVFPA